MNHTGYLIVLECPENEEFIDCGSYCQPTCDKPILDDPNMVCRLDCANCACRKGYIREKAGGKCIPKNTCPISKYNPLGPRTYYVSNSFQDVPQMKYAMIAQVPASRNPRAKIQIRNQIPIERVLQFVYCGAIATTDS
ncbi:hypothetical protein RI129_007907 [Pyrocoelia pectoralis]|uniref:TIL domain-containing protein n=1 Tax=Pyrocoelia pectoralis TaxID=417401 RepID=A0AAN7ZIW9_9COLE